MDSVPTAISFRYQLSRFGDLTTCSKIVLHNLQQEIRDMMKISESESDSNKDKFLYELEKRLASLETAGRIAWLRAFMYMSNYPRTFHTPLRRDWDIPIKSIPLRDINFPDSIQDFYVQKKDH